MPSLLPHLRHHRALPIALALAAAGLAWAESDPTFSAYYSQHPKEWYDAISGPPERSGGAGLHHDDALRLLL